MKRRVSLVVVTVAGLVASAAPFAADPPHLELRSTYSTGIPTGDNAEVISIRHDGIAAITNTTGSVDVLDLSDPLNPIRLDRVLIDTTTGTPNSVAVHPTNDYFLVVTGRGGVTGTLFAHRLSDGVLLASATVGFQPDSVAISPNGKYAVVANEGEGTPPPAGATQGGNGGPGSISIIDLNQFKDSGDDLVVRSIALTSIAGVAGVSSGRTDAIAFLPIDNSPGTLEPENIGFSPDSRYAFVTLQENNAVIRLELKTGDMWVVGLGQTTHAADLTNGAGYDSTGQVLTAFREPDGIVVDQTGRFFVTGDEGDTTGAGGASGPRGGRTVSVFDARTGAFIADTGEQLDKAADAAGVYPGGRSNRGGSEPEGLDITHHQGWTLVAVALERANAVGLVDVSDPRSPKVINVLSLAPQIGPETVKFFRQASRLFVASGNEVSRTVSILEVVF